MMISSSSTVSAAHTTIHSTMSSFPTASNTQALAEFILTAAYQQPQANARQRRRHLPSPSVAHTAFSSSVLPVMVTLVPPPLSGEFFWIRPNSTRLGGIRCPAYTK